MILSKAAGPNLDYNYLCTEGKNMEWHGVFFRFPVCGNALGIYKLKTVRTCQARWARADMPAHLGNGEWCH